MLLKSIDLQGYKTFAGRTTFEFAGAITCIVGPNGSGKSNIADAIRWVLGEQSYRLMRGKKTEDMIFSGSEGRARAGMASANILFDNTDGWLPVDFSEVSITRRAYRDGNNEYLINGQRVRLRDVTELLASSGLSERTYTIIGQGLVDAALALRAEERRRLFEEAAGIGLYRSRREEAHRRLESTFRNIERVEDILAELKPRLRSLERQARRAEQFEQVEVDLKELLRDYYGYYWYRGQRDLSQAREAARVQEAMYQAVRQEQGDLDRKLSTFRDLMQGTRARLASWHRELSKLHNQREAIARDLAVSGERMRLLGSQKEDLKDELARLEQQGRLFQERVEEADQQVSRMNEELNEARSQVMTATQALQARQDERRKVEKEVSETRRKLGETQSHQNRLQARLSERKSQNERQQTALDKAINAVAGGDQELKKAEARFASAEKARDQSVQRSRQAEETLEDHRAELASLENIRREAGDERSNLKTELASLNAQLDVIEQAENALSGYASGTRLLLQNAKKGKLRGTQGALSSQLEVPEALEPAIVAALGEYLDAVLLEDSSTSDEALELLVGNTTKGTLLPVSALTPPEPLVVPQVEGVIGLASGLIKAPPALRPAVDLLLGNTLVVEDRQAARRCLRGQLLTTRAVTLRGELFHASGPISAGQSGGSSTISRPRQRRELGERSAKIQRQLAALEEQIAGMDADIQACKAEGIECSRAVNTALKENKTADDLLNKAALEVDQIKRQNQWQREQRDRIAAEIQQGQAEAQALSTSLVEIGETYTRTQARLQEQRAVLADLSLDELQSQVGYWNTQVAVAEEALANAKAQQCERHTALQELGKTGEGLEARSASYDSTLAGLEIKKEGLQAQETEVVEKIEALRALIDPAEAEVDRLEKDQDKLQETEAKARQGLSLADRRHSQAQMNMTRKQELLDNLRERIDDDLGLVSLEYDGDISGPKPLPFIEMVQRLPVITQLPEGLEETIKRQRAQLRRMGLINPEAQSEYKEVKERFTFMTVQIEDLRKAEKDVKEVIAELDELMERAFNKTFDQVAAEFREIFTRLFGGGSARLVLTDPDDLTETGIEIEARLPGRRSQGLSLLSGGERSLTAAALVFSLLKVSPTPFCVLDEVDAMLDEANVGRFRELLRELSKNTQFIVITHNRNTVQAADVIYGVTMGRDSVSQMISLKLDQVANVI